MRLSHDPQTLEIALRWAAAEGWEPGLHDTAAFATVDPGGWFTARDGDGAPATTLAAQRYDDSFGFMGLYITRPELRGQGIGRQLWSLGRSHLAGCASVGLDGVLQREETYASDGFRRSHLTARFAGVAGALANIWSAASADSLVPAVQLGAQRLAAFETSHELFPTDRRQFVAAWLAQPESTALASISGDGEIQGWGCIRRSVTGWRIGPLFALDPEVATGLLRALGSSVDPHAQVYIDVPEPNRVAVELVGRAGFESVFACIRMYLGERPALDLASVYGNCSFELG